MNRTDQMALARWLSSLADETQEQALGFKGSSRVLRKHREDCLRTLVNEILSPDWPLAAPVGRKRTEPHDVG